jgi:hypothetical protein
MGADKKSQEIIRDMADQKLEDQKAEQVKGGRMKLNPPRG